MHYMPMLTYQATNQIYHLSKNDVAYLTTPVVFTQPWLHRNSLVCDNHMNKRFA